MGSKTDEKRHEALRQERAAEGVLFQAAVSWYEARARGALDVTLRAREHMLLVAKRYGAAAEHAAKMQKKAGY
jgi:hypothetical protein